MCMVTEFLTEVLFIRDEPDDIIIQRHSYFDLTRFAKDVWTKSRLKAICHIEQFNEITIDSI